MARQTSAAGRSAITQREGCRLKAYKDSVGVWTIGVGHTGRASSPVVLPGMKVTQAQSDAYLLADLAAIESAVDGLLKFEPTQNQFDAIISLVHNIGLGQGRFTTSTVLHRFNQDDMAGAADAFLMWDKERNPKTGLLEVSQGLVNRRKAERLQFLTPEDPATPTVEIGSAPLPLPPAAVIDADVGFWARGMKAAAYWLFAIPIQET